MATEVVEGSRAQDPVAKYAAEAAKKTAPTEFSWWKPKESGEVQTGRVSFYGKQDGSKYDQAVLKMEISDDEQIAVGVTSALERGLQENGVEKGDIISIYFWGMGVTKSGTEFKRFEVKVHERMQRELAY